MIKLKHGDYKDCFIRVPYNPTSTVIKLTDLSKVYYLSCMPGSAYEISSILARSLGLSESREVSLEGVQIKVCGKVEVEPADEDSWEIISQNAGFVEANFLTQIRVVQQGMVFPLWVHACCIWIRVVKIEGEWGVLHQNSEVMVRPRDRPERFKGKVLRAVNGGLDFGTNEFTNNTLLACGLHNAVALGFCANGEYREKHVYSYLLEQFEQYKVIQVLTYQNNTVCYLNKFSGEVKSSPGEFVVNCRVQDVQTLIAVRGKVVLFDGMKVKLDLGKIAQVKLKTLINQQDWVGFIVLTDARLIKYEGDAETETIPKSLIEIPSFSTSTQQIRQSLLQNFSACVEGSPGVGKSSLLQSLAKVFESELISPTVLPCRSIGKKDFSKKLLDSVEKAKRCSPSVLMIDDIELVCGKPEDHIGEEAKVLSNMNTLLLLAFLDSSRYSSTIKVLITCRSKISLNPLLSTSTYFSSVFKAPSLTSSDILQILTHTLPHRQVSTFPSQMKSFTLLDIFQFTCTCKVLIKSNPEQDLQALLESFVPSALDSKAKDPSTPWDEIGGLFEAKSLISNSFSFPVKYRALYENYPLRLRSGMLLYGPPGCGKTLLSSAIAGLCGMTCISVKGPELLNKYIGASEQAVREVFERAKRVKPSLIVFDEFEAIVPKRGSGISASTDRIVNQFLCELDGVESRENVFIVAVSSRPELIDQALLRPGRLDFHVLCDFPSCEEREDVLKVIARKIGVCAEFRKCAEIMQDFTPADIQGVFNDLQIRLAHGEIQEIREEDLEKQALVSKPSFNAAQVREFRERYMNFMNRKSVDVGKKVSYY